MKKLAIATLVALLTTAASAAEFGIHTNRDYSGASTSTGLGLSITTQTNKWSTTAAFDRNAENTQDRYSLTAGYDIARVGPVVVTSKAGVAYINNSSVEDGYALTVGLGAKLPLTKNVALTADVYRQYGQERVDQFNGNRAAIGIRLGF